MKMAGPFGFRHFFDQAGCATPAGVDGERGIIIPREQNAL